MVQNSTPKSESFSNIDSNKLFELANQQTVSPILYPVIQKYFPIINLDQDINERWKNITFYIVTKQLIMTNEVNSVFCLFRENFIPIISLKGLFLKQLYPQPELRMMSDIDVLIEEKNMHKAIELLKTLNYYPSPDDLEDPNYMHIEMKKRGSFSVELHRTLWHPTIMNKYDASLWLEHIWKNKRELESEGINYTALALEDEIINLIIHFARHLIDSGASLRNLCDIALFLNRYLNQLDAEYIEETLTSMNLFIFYQYILSTCNMFLGLSFPLKHNIAEEKLNILMNNILSPKIISNSLVTKSKIKSFLLKNSYTKKIIKFIKGFSTKARFLRSIGLRLHLN